MNEELLGYLNRYAWLLELECNLQSNDEEVKEGYRQEYDDLIKYI